MLQVALSFQNSVTYVRHFFKFQVCITNVHINYDFILSRSLISPNLYISWANMRYPDYQNKKLNFCMLNSFKDFHLCIKWAIMWHRDNQLRKNSVCACYCKQIKTSFAWIKEEYKIWIDNLCVSNDIYLLRHCCANHCWAVNSNV